uniref:Immunoglobulin V-set domain-containing protein n=1 Tax=Xiphophorus couchianus TaxID=32473 RepID=A0A3B5MZN1_9TELE
MFLLLISLLLFFLFAILVYPLCQISAENRFVRSGSNLLLEATTTELGENEEFIWKFNTTINLVKFKSGGKFGREPFIKYTERIVFSEQNYSLLLRNMQHNKTAAEYTVRLLLLDPVLKLNKSFFDQIQFDSQISGSFQCENKTCRLVDQTHLKVSSLTVHVEESSIICNHSNQVSWKHDVKNVASLSEKNM